MFKLHVKKFKKRKSLTPEAGLCLSVILSYFFVYSLHLESIVKGVMAGLVILTLLTGGYSLSQKLDPEKLAAWILFLGCVMRIGYMLYTPCYVRPHDLKAISMEGDGHAAYILHILSGRLPGSNVGQFYHPPLYHFLSSLLIFIFRPLLHLTEETDLIDCGRMVSCIFSCLTLYRVKDLCEELQTGKVIPLALAAFLPNFYLMGGRVNNDAIALFFMIMILLFSIRWYKVQNTKNTLILALTFGLGMMSKMSVAVFAVSTGAMMLYVLIKSISGRYLPETAKSLGLFAAVSVPLGLWYPFRNWMLFKQPLNYILDVGDAGFASQNYTYIERFLTFPLTRLLHPLYNNAFEDYNLWMYLLKSALFGEFQFNIVSGVPVTLILMYILLTILMALSVFWAFKQKEGIIRYLILSAAVLMGFYIAFNIRYPYGCTMDFRYVAPAFIIFAMLMGRWLDGCKNQKYGKALYGLTSTVVLVFCLLSIYMFCVI